MNRLSIATLLFLIAFSFLHGEAPAPFADLDGGAVVPDRMKESVFRRFVAESDSRGVGILRAAYFFDLKSKRYRLQAGLPPEASSAIEAVLRKKNASSSFLPAIWRWFIRLNSDIQKRVAGLLSRVRREPPLWDIDYLRRDDIGIFAFSSPATGGVRLVVLRESRIMATATVDAAAPRSLTLAASAKGEIYGAALDNSQLLFFRTDLPGAEEFVRFSIPLVRGKNIRMFVVSSDRALLAWERDGAVHGGVLDIPTRSLRRFLPFAGQTIVPGDAGDPILLYGAKAVQKRLLWDGEHGVRLEDTPQVIARKMETTSSRKAAVQSFRKAGAKEIAHFSFPGGFVLASLSRKNLLVQEYQGQAALPVVTIYGSQAWAVVLLVLVISLGYGFIHASGPGHGKALVMAYFVDNTHVGWWPPAKMAMIVSTVHTGSALILATLFQVIFSITPDQMIIRKWFTIGSGLLVMLLGVYMLVSRIRNNHHETDAVAGSSDKKTMLALGLAAGIVPCPLSMGVMVIAIVNGVYLLGVLSVLGMSIGMFVLIFMVGALTSRSREKLEKFLSRRSRFARTLSMVAGVASALFILVLGFALMVPVL